jgi:Xaa-Pro aminopeptidase
MSHEIAQERLERVRALCAEQGWHTVLGYGNLWRCDFVRYLTDFALVEGHGVALLSDDGAVKLYLESPVEAERAAVEAPGCEVIWEPDLVSAVAREVGRAGNRSVGAAPMNLMPEGIARAFGDNVVDALPGFMRLLTEKTEREIAAVRRAAQIADDGYPVFCEAARVGRTEYEVMADFEAYLRSRGCADNFQIMASGGQEVRGMHPPGERRLQKGDLVTTELTPIVDGYFAQLCRTLVIGEPSPAQQAAFEIYLEAMEAGIAKVAPGATANDVAKAENDVFRAHGLGEYTTNKYTRVRGHGIGMFLDNPPTLLEGVDQPITANMTMIVHPNTYNPNVGYMVFGDSLVVRDSGPEILTKTERKLFSVPG